MKRCFKNCLKSYFTVEFRALWWVCVYLSAEQIQCEGHFPDSTSHVCLLCFITFSPSGLLNILESTNTRVGLYKTVSHSMWAVRFFSWNLLIQLSETNLATSPELHTSFHGMSCKRSSLYYTIKTRHYINPWVLFQKLINVKNATRILNSLRTDLKEGCLYDPETRCYYFFSLQDCIHK